MRKIISSSGKEVFLLEKLGEGGEGTVYRIESGSQSEVAKIYHEPTTEQLFKKLSILSIIPRNSEIRKIAALPTNLLYDHNGIPIGYTMDHIRDHYPLHEISNPGSLRKNFPKWTFKHLWRIACNLSLSLAKIHQQNIIVGDINENNILVSSQCTVVFIDSDSFQIRNSGRLFPCLTGIPDYTPPELIDCDFSNTERTNSHDCFGLSICIFQLLIAGRHPFSGTHNPDLLSAIKSRNLPFNSNSSSSTDKFANPLWMALPQSVRQLLFEGLVNQPRPDTAKFFSVLEKTEGEIKQRCSQKLHFSSSAPCPWCAIFTQYNIDFFSDIRLAGNTVYELICYITDLERRLNTVTNRLNISKSSFATPNIINPESLRGIPLHYRGLPTSFKKSETRFFAAGSGAFIASLSTIFVYFWGSSNFSNAVSSLFEIRFIIFILLWFSCLIIIKVYLPKHPYFVFKEHLISQTRKSLDRYGSSLKSLNKYTTKRNTVFKELAQNSNQCKVDLNTLKKIIQGQQESDRAREIARRLSEIKINQTSLPSAKNNTINLLKQAGYSNLSQLNRRTLLSVHGIGEVTTNAIMGNIEKLRCSIGSKLFSRLELGEINKLQTRVHSLAVKANKLIDGNKNDSELLRELESIRQHVSNEQADSSQDLADAIESLRSIGLPHVSVTNNLRHLIKSHNKQQAT